MNDEVSSETERSKENEEPGLIESIIGLSCLAFLCLSLLWLVFWLLGFMAMATKFMLDDLSRVFGL